MNATQRTDIETALDAMAIEPQAHGLLKHPVDGKYLLAIRHVRELPPNTRRLRSDFNGRHHGPQQQIPEVV
jgi:hypothetical protein